MAAYNIVGLLAIVGCLAVVKAYPNGPPDTVCESMTPNQQSHGTAQNSPSPYTVIPSKLTYMPGEMINVTFNSPANSNFKGIFVQARLKNGQNTQPQGTFMLMSGETQLKLMNCVNRPISAVSHNSRDLKTTKTLIWKAPNTNVGDVRFMVTFVRDTTTFWQGVVSADVRGMNAGGSSAITLQGILIAASVATAGFLQMMH